VTSLAELQEALRQDPRNAALWVRMGNALHAHGHDGKALVCFERALELHPGHVDAEYNRGVVLHALGRVADALACYEAVAASHPQHPAAEDNRLAALVALDRHAEAIPALEQRLVRGPRDADTLVNLGLARQAEGNFDAAMAAFEEALRQSPGHRLAGWNLALLALRLGHSERGFALYEAYWPGNSRVNRVRDFARPSWEPGDAIAGRSVLLHADEGLGDTIQYLRFVPEVVRRASRVVLEVPRALAPLARSLDEGFVIVEAGTALPATDLHAPLHGLPARLGAKALGAPVPYLRAGKDRVAHWRETLGSVPGLHVGLAWRGNPSHPEDRLRSIALEQLQPLFGVPGVHLVSLQLDPPPEDAAALAQPGAPDPVAETARGMAETAALVSALDLVITVDTSIAHLAGALGRPTWILLAARADWRWLEGAERTAWYPTATLHRAARGERWDEVARRIRSELQRFVKLPP